MDLDLWSRFLDCEIDGPDTDVKCVEILHSGLGRHKKFGSMKISMIKCNSKLKIAKIEFRKSFCLQNQLPLDPLYDASIVKLPVLLEFLINRCHCDIVRGIVWGKNQGSKTNVYTCYEFFNNYC